MSHKWKRNKGLRRKPGYLGKNMRCTCPVWSPQVTRGTGEGDWTAGVCVYQNQDGKLLATQES